MHHDRTKERFRQDDSLPKQFQSKLADYANTGYDRGHLVPVADSIAPKDTFLLSNTCPQHPSLNRGAWARLERFVRSLTNLFDTITVYTGPLYVPHLESDGCYYVKFRMLGNPPNTAVPTHFFKIVISKQRHETIVGAFLLPNQAVSEPLFKFIVPVDAIESLSGIEFSKLIGAEYKELHECIPNDIAKELHSQKEVKIYHHQVAK